MKYSKIVLAGGNGYLGTVLATYFKDLSEEIIILSRKPGVSENNIRIVEWDAQTEGKWSNSLEGADLLINLCGKNVNCRYTERNKAEIISSRILPTRLLGRVINQLKCPPKLWINVTSATIYRHAEDHAQTESEGETGSGFSVEVCKLWEQAFREDTHPATRKIALRMAIVLGNNDGVFPRLVNLVKSGLGGKQGSGRQYISWVHEQDVVKIIDWLFAHPEMEGVINCSAPTAIRNDSFMEVLRSEYGCRIGLPAPEWLLNIGAALIGTETELILKSRWVEPESLLKSGYRFEYETAPQAIHQLVCQFRNLWALY